jgi:hypothetical protein
MARRHGVAPRTRGDRARFFLILAWANHAGAFAPEAGRRTYGSDAPRNALTYSFLPNLVWLPSQLAKLSDREGSFVQTLAAVSRRIYRGVKLR